MTRIEARTDIGRDVVALTFDDGPSVWTDAILDHFARHNARATFFVLGCTVAERPDTVRRILASGSELGNHTFSHPHLTALDDDEIRNEITRAAAAIEGVAGAAPVYWRAPFFDSDERVNAVVAQLGLREVWYSSIPGDWELPADETVRRVLDDLRPGGIVCLHDGRPPDEPAELSDPTREATAEAVRRILETMDARGLKAVTVSGLLAAP